MAQRPVDEHAICRNCAFFFDAGYRGYCHRRAPVMDADGHSRFPPMEHYGWCGEFATRPTPEGTP